MKIGVLSDTHIPKKAKEIPKEVLQAFERVDFILHAGDILEPWVLERLGQLAPVEAVAGNIDPPKAHRLIGRKKALTFGGFNFGLVHGDGKGGSTADRAFKAFEGENVDCIVFGHSHIPLIQERNGVLLFNPGSPTDKRRQKEYSYGIIYIYQEIQAKIIYF